MRGLPAPLLCGLKIFEGGFHTERRPGPAVHLYYINEAPPLKHNQQFINPWQMTSEGGRKREVILWLKALNIPSHSLCALYINHKASSAAMLLQIFEPFRAKPQQWRCETHAWGRPHNSFCLRSPSWKKSTETPYLLLTGRWWKNVKLLLLLDILYLALSFIFIL